VRVVALILGMLAAGWVGWLTRAPGPGLSPDGMSYLGAARSIAAGHLPYVPFADWSDDDSTSRLRDYPPGFSTLIAVASFPNRPAESGGRWVEIVAAFVVVGGIALILGRAQGAMTGIAGALAFVAAPVFIADYSIVLSEPPFLAILVALLGVLALESPPVWLVAALCSAGVMVRYVGLFLAGAAALSMFLRDGPMPSRLKRAMGVSLPPLGVFLAWNHWAGGAREYGLKPGFLKTLAQGSVTVQTWLAPWVDEPLPRLLFALIVLGLVGAAIVGVRRAAPVSPSQRIRRAALILAAGFVGMMLFSRLVADDAIIFDDRLLSPLLLFAVVVTASACGDLWAMWSGRMRALVASLFVAWLLGSMRLDQPLVNDLLVDGWGYASADWQSSEVAQWLRTDGRRYALYSDNASATYSLDHRPSRVIPDSTTPAIMAGFGDALRAHPSALIGYASPYSPDAPRAGLFARRIGLVQVLRSDEAAVWVTAPADSQRVR
jgi:hypothetical protein